MPMNESVTRREFLEASAAGVALAGTCLGSTEGEAAEVKLKPADAKAAPELGPVIDCHAHLSYPGSSDSDAKDRKLIEAADIGYTGSPLGKPDNGLPSNCSIEISRLSATLGDELAALLSTLGPERLVFGSGMPFKYPDPALLKLEVLDASEDVKEKIRSGNAAGLF